jgi:hypothetical protein
VRRFWNWIRDRHEDGSKHAWFEVPLQVHPCYGYCHHYQVSCPCGASRLFGDSVEEVR